jgi:hypothetical protein
VFGHNTLYQQIVLKIRTMITFTMQDLAKQVGHDGERRLRGRELGRKFQAGLREKILSTPHDELLRFDLRDVQMMDVSFIDELFGGIAEARGRGELSGAALLLVEVDPLDVDDIGRILAGRPGSSTGLRNCVLPLVEADSIRLLGKTEDYVQETFSELLQAKSLSTSELMSRLDLANNTASTRLKVLYDLGLARRVPQTESRGYVYHMLI